MKASGTIISTDAQWSIDKLSSKGENINGEKKNHAICASIWHLFQKMVLIEWTFLYSRHTPIHFWLCICINIFSLQMVDFHKHIIRNTEGYIKFVEQMTTDLLSSPKFLFQYQDRSIKFMQMHISTSVLVHGVLVLWKGCLAIPIRLIIWA